MRRQAILAGAWLCVVLAGCSTVDWSGIMSFRSDGTGRDRVVAGSIETVAESTQASLTQMGFVASKTRKGDSIRIESKTATGIKFALVCSRVKGKDGEQTRVHLEWDGAGDDQTAFQILAQVESFRKS